MTPTATHSTATDRWRQRELQIAREIAQAFLQASHPLEVYRSALSRVTSLVDASFSSVFLRDPGDPDLLKLECAQNWPQSSARFLSQMRIRVGRGPTGQAVAENRAIDVGNVFEDPALREWWDPARELGFAALVALPLQAGDDVVGALSFYFAEPHLFNEAELQLLQLLADQLAATARRAHALEDLRQTNESLRRENAALREEVGAAEASKRVKDEFVANMSHELRTPLNSILGYAFLLTEGQAGRLSPEQLHAVRRMHASADVLLRLIDDLLDLSQLKLGRAELLLADDDALRLARHALECAGDPAAGVDFVLRTDDDALPIVTDGEKVSKILENLLSNAFKFTTSGTVTLHVARTAGPGGEWIEWRVQDTGIGIAAEQRDAIFDEFRQVDGSSTRLYGGTGLGLALSRRLATLLGGSIELDSEAGDGATFTLRLPVRLPAGTGRGTGTAG